MSQQMFKSGDQSVVFVGIPADRPVHDREGDVTVCVGNAVRRVPCATLNKSQLLHDLLQQDAAAADVVIPVAASGMLHWLQHVEGHTGAPRPGAEAASVVAHGVERMKELLQAADVLIDEATKAEMCRELAVQVARMPRAAATAPTPAHSASPVGMPVGMRCTHAVDTTQIFTGLSEDLTLSILKVTALPACLTALPPAMHASALAAHAPAIRHDSTLTLPHLPPHLLPAAAAAAAAFPHLRSLSLAGQVLAQHGASLSRMLCALPALTALSLADGGLRAACGRALTDALPRLPHLQSLDLSSNRLPRRAFQNLCSALRSLSMLTQLSFEDTIAYDVPSHMHALSEALPQLSSLATFSIGSLSTQHETAWESAFTQAFADLMRVLCAAPCLSSLDLHFRHGMCNAAPEEFATLWKALGDLRQLRRLSLAVPIVKSSMQGVPLWERELGRSLHQLSQLTELALWLEANHKVAHPPSAPHVIAPLSKSTALRRLRLPWFAAMWGLGRAVPGTEPPRNGLSGVLRLPHLTSLQIQDDQLRDVAGLCRLVEDPAGTPNLVIKCDDIIAELLCAENQLRSLYVPLHSFSTTAACYAPEQLALRLRDAGADAQGPPTSGLPAPALDHLNVRAVFASLDDESLPDDEQRRLLAPFLPLLPITDSLDLLGQGALWLTPLMRDMSVLRGLTRLQITVQQPNSASLAAYTAFIKELSALCALREMTINLHREASATAGSAMPQTAVYPAFCTHLPALTALTSLTVSMSAGQAEMTEVVAACAAHRGLLSLELELHTCAPSFQVTSLPVGALCMLRSLTLRCSAPVDADDFWAELPQLTALRVLRLHAALSEGRLMQLAGTARDALPVLRELHVTGVPDALSCILSLAELPCMLVCSP